MLHFHHGNRLEVLAGRLAAVLAEPPADPFAADVVVVPTPATGQWLAWQLARGLGICANVRFPLPAAWLWELFRAVLDDVPAEPAWAPEVLGWRILDRLPELAVADPEGEIGGYLAGADDRMRIGLAQRLGALYDQYLVYRPDWIAGWERGDGAGDDWQAVLWRRLAGDAATPHWARLHAAFLARLRRGAGPGARLPARACAFGTAALSPAYLEALAAVGTRVDLHLFLLDPCRHYWAQIRSHRELARLERVDEEAEHYEIGHPLLASLGRQGRELFDLIAGHEPLEEDAFVEPARATALGRLQADILDLRDGAAEPSALPAADGSIVVHDCHGPLREVEVLHDQLLGLFEQLPDLAPADVLVLTPDIDAYAPYIEAVFGAASGDRHVPWALADRGARAASPLVDAWLRLLAVAGSRWYADDVLALLDCPALAARFGLEDADRELVGDWVRATGIRWGRDAQAREDLGLPACVGHTWRAGLDRLLLGYALPGDGTRLHAGLLPCAPIEGSAARALGGLAGFVDALAALERRLAGKRAPAQWCDELLRVTTTFFLVDAAGEAELDQVRAALAAARAQAARADCRTPVDAAAMAAVVAGAIEAAPARTRLPGGVATFAAMVPLRSLPARVVCLLGMNDGALPRRQPRPGYDRLAARPRRGDRSRREDDRGLFLDAILSARDVLYLSYVGRDQRDNSPRPPSVLVEELLDCVRRSHAGAPGAEPAAGLVIAHPLQPFSARYFDGGPLWSYAREQCAALVARTAAGGAAPAPFIGGDLPATDAGEPAALDVAGLRAFWRNPARALLRDGLGITLPRAEEPVERFEPFALEGLARWQLGDRLLGLLLAGHAPEAVAALVDAEGRLPHGAAGAAAFAEVEAAIRPLAARVAQARAGPPLPPLAVALALDGLRLGGELDGLDAGGLLDCTASKLAPQHWLDAWLRHLILCACAPPGVAPASRFLAADGGFELPPLTPADALPPLAALARLAWTGRRRALPFFRKASAAYARAALAGKADPDAQALKAWTTDARHHGDDEDPWAGYLWRDAEPLAPPFADLALAVYRPLAAAAPDFLD